MHPLEAKNSLEIEPEKLDKELASKFDFSTQSNWSRQELEAYDRYLDAFRSSEGQIETAENRGIAKGKEEGRLEGERKKAIEIAQDLLDVLDVETIAKKTKLSIEQIEELKKQK